MFSKMSKRTKVSSLIGLLCALLLAGAIYFYYQNAAEPVHIRIYMVPERSEKKAEPPPTSFQQVMVRPTTQIPTSEVSHYEQVEDTHDYDLVYGHTDDSDFFLADDSEPEETTNSNFSARLVDLAAQIEAVTTRFSKKYPDLIDLANLSLDEIHELYPTPEALAALAKQSEKARAEFMTDFSSLFSELPTEIREECLSFARETLVASWGTETADAVMTELRAHLGYR